MATAEEFQVSPEAVEGMEANAENSVLPEITVFEHRDFDGDSWRTTFGYSYVGDDWNDIISSFIIHAGYFEFYEHADYQWNTWQPVRLGPGQYQFVGNHGIGNDTISSWKAFFGD